MKIEDLHYFVHSLSEAEKRRFIGKAKSQGSTAPNYMRLYKALAATRKFNEVTLERNIQNQKITGNIQLHKKYLKEQLIDSVTYSRLEAQTDRYTVQKERLVTCYQRSLFEEAGALAEGLLDSNLAHWQEMEILFWMWKIKEAEGLGSWDQLELKAHFRKYKKPIATAGNASLLRKANARLKLQFEKDGFARDRKTTEMYRKLLKSPVLDKTQYDQPSELKLLYNTKALGHVILGGYKKAIKWSKLEIELLDPELDQVEFVHAHNNLLLGLLYSGKIKQFAKTMAMLESLKPKGSVSQVVIFEVVWRNTLRALILQGKFSEGETYADAFEKRFHELKHLMSDEMVSNTAFYLFHFWFGCGDLIRAKKALNLVLNAKGEARRDLQNFARILNVLLHFERGDIQYFDSLVRSIMHFSKVNWKLSKFGQTILQFVKAMRSSPSKEKEHLQELHVQLTKLSTSQESRAFEYFDFLSWADAKLSGQPYAVVLQKSWKARTSA